MKISLTGGTGYIGRALVAAFVARGDRCVVVSRGAVDPWNDGRVTVVRGDPRHSGRWMDEVASADVVINLAGARLVEPPHRWTAARKQAIRSSRIETTHRVVEAIARADRPPATLISASAVGYYGARGDEVLGEGAGPGDDFLASLCVEWERATDDLDDATTVTLVRTGLVIGRGSPLLQAMVPAFRLGLGGPWGPGTQWWPWVHIDDVVGLALHALDERLAGPVNVTAPEAVRVAQFAKELGRALGRPALARVPGFLLRMGLGEVADALLASQRVVPERAIETGYRFRFPNLTSALGEVFAA